MTKSPFEVEVHLNTTPICIVGKLFKDVRVARHFFDTILQSVLRNIGISEPGIVVLRLLDHKTGTCPARWDSVNGFSGSTPQ